MDLQSRNAEDQAPGPQPVQFSLGSLLLVMTATAVFLSALLHGTAWMVMATIWILLAGWPMVLTVVLIYSRGWRRTFCIGALFPTAPMLLAPSSLLSFFSYAWNRPGAFAFDERVRLGLACLGMLVASIVCGLAALGVRRLVEPTAQRQEARPAADDATEENGYST